MHHAIDAFNGAGQRVSVGDVTDRKLMRKPLQKGAVAGLAHEDTDAVTSSGKLFSDMRTEEAGCAGDEDIHG